MRFFFYGTLMDPQVRRAVLGRSDDHLLIEQAVLPGYRRIAATSGNVPVLMRVSGGRVRGLLAQGLEPADLWRIAHFEGRHYHPFRRRVIARHGHRLEAWVFLADSARWSGGRDWDFARWRRRERARLLRRIARWMREPGFRQGHAHDVSRATYCWIRALERAKRPSRQEPCLRAAE